MEIYHLLEIVRQALLRGAVLLALAGLATLLMWRASAAQRHLVWALAVAGMLLLPLLAAVLPAWRVRLPALRTSVPRPAAVSPAPAAASAPAAVAPGNASPAGVTAPPAPAVTADVPALPAVPPPGAEAPPATPIPAGRPVLILPRVNWPAAALLLWSLGALLLLARSGAGLLRTRRIVRAAAPAGEDWQTPATEISALLRLRRPLRLLMGGVTVPIVCGIFRPCLLLPPASAAWPEERRRAVLLHELAHVRRGDCLTQWLAHLTRTLHWPNPLAWLAAHRLRVEREAACDDLVLAAGIHPSAYAAHLLEIARALRGKRPVYTGIAIAHSSKLGRRLCAILNNRRSCIGLASLIAILLLLGGAAVIISMLRSEDNRPRITETPAEESHWKDEFHRPEIWVAISGIGPQPPERIEKVGAKERVVTEFITDPYGYRQAVPRKEGALYDDITTLFTLNGGQLAYTARRGKDWYMIFTDQQWGPYASEPSRPEFSPDGKRIAYVVDGLAVIDGKPGAKGAFNGGKQFIFSPDSRRVAYHIRDGRLMRYVIDGREQPPYALIGGFTFSPDSRHVAYLTETDDTVRVIHDRREGKAYKVLQEKTVRRAGTGITQFSLLLFSEDGSGLVYGAVDNGEGVVVLNGREIARHKKRIIQIEISPNGRKVAYRIEDDPHIYTNDGRKYRCPRGYLDSSLTFNPDGAYLLFVARDGGGQSVFVNGKPGRSYATIQRLYDKDNATTGYLVFHANKSFHYFIQKDAARPQMLVVEETLPRRTEDIGKAPAAFIAISLPTTVSADQIAVSPDGSHAAWIEETDGKQSVLIDGKPGPRFDHIRAPWMLFDPGESDRNAAAPQQSLSPGVFFSLDGRRHAYVIGQWEEEGPVKWRQARQAMVVDGKAGAFYDEVSMPAFSPGGRHLAYHARKGTQWVVVIDGKESKAYDRLGGRLWRKALLTDVVTFSPDGSRMAYVGKTGAEWHAVIDGKEGPAYDWVSKIVFSPDGRQVAYIAGRQGVVVVVLNGKEGLRARDVQYPTFSPDGKRFACIAGDLDAKWTVCDGKAGKRYSMIHGAPVFSPDGKRLAYRVGLSGNTSRQMLVVDGKESAIYGGVGEPVFSPDGRRLAYKVSRGNQEILIVDGKEIPGGSEPVFSPDGKHLAYQLRKDGKVAIVVDGKATTQQGAPWARSLRFSLDSRHLVAVMQDREQFFTMVDSRPGERYDSILSPRLYDTPWTGEYIFFDAPDRFHYFAVKDGKVQWVEETIPAATPA